MPSPSILTFILIIIPTLVLNSFSTSKKDNGIDTLYPQLAATAPVIDGELDDEVWKENPLAKEFITYNPLYGEKFPQKTLIWTAYDGKNIYFAFKCI